MKKNIVLLSLILFCSSAYSESWMHSTSPEVKLSVWDRDGTSANKIKFVVTYPSGKKTTAFSDVDNSDASFVYFPSDFDYYVGTESGVYKWVAFVNGKPVASANFTYKGTKTSSNLSVPF